jgi:hypothetical protein
LVSTALHGESAKVRQGCREDHPKIDVVNTVLFQYLAVSKAMAKVSSVDKSSPK